jgi:hypothetical protein
VSYTVTNQALITKTWSMQPIAGITQIADEASDCPDPFTLASSQSCVLKLQLAGADLPERVVGGPVICVANDKLNCYQPAAAGELDVTVVIFADGFV